MTAVLKIFLADAFGQNRTAAMLHRFAPAGALAAGRQPRAPPAMLRLHRRIGSAPG
ncbi:hypothetical protein [Burkholderia sp. Bp9031]|uniref:hypothetical protein n=1 Tax=Burkholderia sp. Bp9031 TaxID=2184566 RepID=UPI00163A4C77|nr:hypothetical protein [Burkholderia sp. Bp9031]